MLLRWERYGQEGLWIVIQGPVGEEELSIYDTHGGSVRLSREHVAELLPRVTEFAGDAS